MTKEPARTWIVKHPEVVVTWISLVEAVSINNQACIRKTAVNLIQLLLKVQRTAVVMSKCVLISREQVCMLVCLQCIIFVPCEVSGGVVVQTHCVCGLVELL